MAAFSTGSSSAKYALVVVVRDQWRHRSEDVGDVDAIDRNQLGADELALLGGDDEDAVIELVQRNGVRVLPHPMVVDWMDRCVAVAWAEQRDCAHQRDRERASIVRVERVDLRGLT